MVIRKDNEGHELDKDDDVLGIYNMSGLTKSGGFHLPSSVKLFWPDTLWHMIHEGQGRSFHVSDFEMTNIHVPEG